MKLPERLREALDATGLPWVIELGGKHYKVRLAGKLVSIYPKGKGHETDKRALLNTITQVRRAARELQST
jgi:hypothetical protein